jgi:hypothetical protein
MFPILIYFTLRCWCHGLARSNTNIGLAPSQTGFGSLVPQNIVFKNGIPTTAAVDTPQIVSAFIYLFYTGLLRCMLAGEQW